MFLMTIATASHYAFYNKLLLGKYETNYCTYTLLHSIGLFNLLRASRVRYGDPSLSRPKFQVGRWSSFWRANKSKIVLWGILTIHLHNWEFNIFNTILNFTIVFIKYEFFVLRVVFKKLKYMKYGSVVCRPQGSALSMLQRISHSLLLHSSSSSSVFSVHDLSALHARSHLSLT